MNSFENKYDSIENMIFLGKLRIKAVHIHQDLDLILIVLNNGKILKHTISTNSPVLKKAKIDELNDYRLIGKGVGIHWPKLDVDLSLKGFLRETLTAIVAA